MTTIHWPNLPASDPVAGRLGYATASLSFRDELQRVGALDANSENAVWFGTPYHYRPTEDSRNFLFTMWESVEVPPEFAQAFELVDAVIVPSTYCKEILEPHAHGKPVHVCPLGVNTKVFTYKQRKVLPPFRWGWVGAPNFRKYSLLTLLHRDLIGPLSAYGVAELYMKTTGLDESRFMLEAMQMGVQPEWNIKAKTIKGPGWTVDNRKVPIEELAKLYQSFHGFLGLHIGEGFGLNVLEAMATGCPTIVTGYSGTTDFCTEENSYPVKYTLGRHRFFFDDSPDKDQGTILGAMPDAEDVVCKITGVMTDYPRALEKGVVAARTAQKLSWAAVTRRLLQIVSLPVGRDDSATPEKGVGGSDGVQSEPQGSLPGEEGDR